MSKNVLSHNQKVNLYAVGEAVNSVAQQLSIMVEYIDSTKVCNKLTFFAKELKLASGRLQHQIDSISTAIEED